MGKNMLCTFTANGLSKSYEKTWFGFPPLSVLQSQWNCICKDKPGTKSKGKKELNYLARGKNNEC